MADAPRDSNHVPALLLESSTNPGVVLTAKGDQATGRLLVDSASGSGTVTSVSVVTANGFAGTVANATTTPAITLSTTVTGIIKGNGTAISAATAGTDYTALAFKTISVATQNDIVADSAADTLTLVAGTNITITTNDLTDSITINTTGLANTALSNLAAVAINAALLPGADNTIALGDVTHNWSDLFLGSGAVINFNNGEATITETNANLLTLAGADLSLPALNVIGTAGAGFITLIAQAANPAAPAAGTLLLHSSTNNGFTRMEQDNEATTNLIYGRDSVFIAKNVQGAGITKGQVVYVFGSIGAIPTVKLAQANSSTTLPAVGIVVDNIADNAFGQIMIIGVIDSINTNAFNTGDQLWVDPAVAGGLVSTRPSGTTNFVQRIGTVLNKGVGNGSLYIDIAPALQNRETGTNQATFTASAIVGTSITGTSILATANDVGALGASGTAFSDLFLASGAVIDFATANAVITHSSGVLTVSTGTLKVTTPTNTTTSVVTIDGTQTLTNKTLGDALTMAENAAFLLDPALSADGKYNGITRAGTAGTTLAFGDLIYLDPTDSRWELADANSAAGADGDSRGVLGICVLAAAADGDPTTILLYGIVRADTAFPTFTVNNPVYVSETAGDVTGTQPTTADVVIRVVGVGLTGDELFFNPSPDYITHT